MSTENACSVSEASHCVTEICLFITLLMQSSASYGLDPFGKATVGFMVTSSAYVILHISLSVLICTRSISVVV